jgi:hypothetical protein
MAAVASARQGATMSGSERVVVRDLLIEAGYPETWVSAKAAHVSRIYYHHRRPGANAPKDGAGIAVYGPEDRPGLLDVARELKDGDSSAANREGRPICNNPDCAMWCQDHGGPCEI